MSALFLLRRNLLPRNQVLLRSLSLTVPFSRKKAKPLEHSTSEANFDTEAEKVLQSIQKALTPLESMNERFVITRIPDELQIDTGEKVNIYIFSPSKHTSKFVISLFQGLVPFQNQQKIPPSICIISYVWCAYVQVRP